MKMTNGEYRVLEKARNIMAQSGKASDGEMDLLNNLLERINIEVLSEAQRRTLR